MAKRSGNGKHGGDLIVALHSEVVGLRAERAEGQRRSDERLARIARMLGQLGDTLSDHERRLSAVEAKVA